MSALALRMPNATHSPTQCLLFIIPILLQRRTESFNWMTNQTKCEGTLPSELGTLQNLSEYHMYNETTDLFLHVLIYVNRVVLLFCPFTHHACLSSFCTCLPYHHNSVVCCNGVWFPWKHPYGIRKPEKPRYVMVPSTADINCLLPRIISLLVAF